MGKRTRSKSQAAKSQINMTEEQPPAEPVTAEPVTAEPVMSSLEPAAKKLHVDLSTYVAGDSQIEEASKTSILSDSEFTSLDICEPLKRGLEKMGLSKMTQIQAYAIPKMLEGKDVLAAAKTGSGKTLAFVVPALDLLYRAKVEPCMGTVVLVLTPTRELALQIGEVVREAGEFVSHTFGTVIGGASKNTEANKLTKGVNFLVATPGRLLDHMKTTTNFLYKHLQTLIIDEADRMLDQGFERDLTSIVKLLPTKRQTALFSATQTTKVADLIRMSMRNPTLIEIKNEEATVEGLEQGYILVDSDQRLPLLFKLLKKKLAKGEKIMVFFSTCKSVAFHQELFTYIDLPCLCLHGQMKQGQRQSAYTKFLQMKSGIMLCTNVAARGLDFPAVDLIVQYDPPDEVREYIHRVGRTARGDSRKGAALLFLLTSEVGFIKVLSSNKVKAKEFKTSFHDLARIDDQIRKVVRQTYSISLKAHSACQAYMLAYDSHSNKEIFSLKKLDKRQVAHSFGLETPPRVELDRKKKFSSSTVQ